MRSPFLAELLSRLLEQRQFLYRKDLRITSEALWSRPEPGRWSIGETLQHLTKMARLFRRLSAAALVLQRPLARLREHRPYATRSQDIFARAALPAPFLVRPRRPRGTPTLEEVLQALERETALLQNGLECEKEAILGHTWLWDPVMGAQNLLQVVDLLVIHEEHHFRIAKRRWAELFSSGSEACAPASLTPFAGDVGQP